MYKRNLVVTAAVLATVGALVPWTAYAGAPASGSPASGSATTSKVTHFSSATVGTLTADMQISDMGTKTVGVDVNGSIDTAYAITGYSISFGDGKPPLNVGASTTSVGHWYDKPGAYTVSVTVTDAHGTKATTSGQYVTQGTNYTAYGPTRLLDTRNGTGAPVGAVAAGGTVKLKIAGNGSIPANVVAVVLNVTATAPTAAGTITAYPDGSPEPGTQNVTFVSGQAVATLSFVTVGPDGYVDLTNNSTGTTHMVADIAGYFTASSASGYTSLTPARLLDTRYGIGAPAGMVGNGQQVVLTIAGADGGALPASGITAVALNVTAAGPPIGGGYITAYPDGTARPISSNVNFNPGDVRANLVIVPVGADGKIDLFNASSGTQIIADVAGYFSANGASDYAPIAAQRILDTRTSGNNPIPAAQAIGVDITDTTAGGGWTTGQTGYVVTTTVTDTMAGGYLTVYPYGVTRPTVSTLNFSPGQTTANLALATSGQDNSSTAATAKASDFYNGTGGTLNLIVDMSGYFDTY